MASPAPWRVVMATRVLPVALGFHAALREAGHEPVALLTVRDATGRYGSFDLGGVLGELPDELDVLMPARRTSMAALLESVRPDLVPCSAFPWKIPADALSVPALGWINGHPSLSAPLPNCTGLCGRGATRFRRASCRVHSRTSAARRCACSRRRCRKWKTRGASSVQTDRFGW